MNKRKRKRKSSALRYVEIKYGKKSNPAKVSDYLYWLKHYYRKHSDMVAVIYIRESGHIQWYRLNQQNYEYVLRRKFKKLNVPVIGCYSEVNSGWILNNRREALVCAINEAKKHKDKKAVIVTTLSDRFLRNRLFHTKDNPDILPTEYEFEKFMKLTCDIPLATLLHPDMPWNKVRSYQTKWGQRVKGNKGGRPKKNKPDYKKQIRLEKLPVVLQMYRKHYPNMSLRDIATATGIPKPTVWYWIKKYGDKII